MADRSLDVLVRILTEQVGQEKANDVLAKYTEATKAAGAESELLTGSTRRLGEAAAEAGKGIEKAEIPARELHHLAGLLNRVLPESGEALKGLAHQGDSSALAFMGIIAAVEMGIEAFKEYRESAEKADKAMAALMDMKFNAGVVQAVKDAWVDANIAEEVYYRNLARNSEDVDNRIADESLSAAKTKASAQQQINDAAKALELAKVEEMERAGVISHEQAIAAKYQLDVRYIQMKLALEKDADSQELQIQQALLATEQGKKSQVDADVAGKFATANQATVAVERNAKKTEADKASIEDAKKVMDASGLSSEQVQRIREIYEKGSGKASSGQGAASLDDQYMWLLNNLYYGNAAVPNLNLHEQAEGMGIFLPKMLGGNGITRGQVQAYSGAETTINKLQPEVRRGEEQAPELKEREAVAKSDLEAAKQVQGELTRTIRELGTKIDLLAATNQAKEQNAGTVAGLQAQADAVKTGQVAFNPHTAVPAAAGANPAAVALEKEGISLAAVVKAGHATNQQKNALVKIAGEIAGHQVTMAEAVRAMEMAATNNVTFMGQVSRLVTVLNRNATEIETLKRWMNNHIDQHTSAQ